MEYIHCIQILPVTPVSELLLDPRWVVEQYPVLVPAAATAVDEWKGFIYADHAVRQGYRVRGRNCEVQTGQLQGLEMGMGVKTCFSPSMAGDWPGGGDRCFSGQRKSLWRLSRVWVMHSVSRGMTMQADVLHLHSSLMPIITAEWLRGEQIEPFMCHPVAMCLSRR